MEKVYGGKGVVLPWIWFGKEDEDQNSCDPQGRDSEDQTDGDASTASKDPIKCLINSGFCFLVFQLCSIISSTHLRWRREERLVLLAPESGAGGCHRIVALPKLFYAKRIAVVFWPAKICAMVLSSWDDFILFSLTWWPFTLLSEQPLFSFSFKSWNIVFFFYFVTVNQIPRTNLNCQWQPSMSAHHELRKIHDITRKLIKKKKTKNKNKTKKETWVPSPFVSISFNSCKPKAPSLCLGAGRQKKYRYNQQVYGERSERVAVKAALSSCSYWLTLYCQKVKETHNIKLMKS